ncbi:thiol-disulfide isomerase [Vibrio sp. 10N.286.49.C2]|uniref:thiol:disulfide interchange protein DsbA/DsbL n=1 Tax=unclassified Vibrio TaxID=2614977 RepID=UPI000C864FF9|nr:MULTISPECIES: thiol:disulfide interchange protein DsbA/DsbL [unclassified Vibrio]PMH38248.1 thiol-disulfide isomerase [Vibrio sp. 10N.286.49.C2]PMH55656.1 thiol-disulfide isomerase [Vibrio sp. 10N.286.49.B1]PMH83444.1 thiol-disulfide isomerase [Vibrio sp. 10N.286.48.B7]
MIKSLTKILTVLSLAAVITACGESDTPVEGKQYSVLPNDLSQLNLPQVTEVFSLGCGHCRNLEPMLPELEELTDSKLGKIHVMFNDSAQIAAMIFYSAVMQSKDQRVPEDMKLELFSLVQNQDLDGQQKQIELDRIFASRTMVSPYALDEAQQKELFEYVELANKVSTEAQINAVPTFIVNGKYEVMLAGHEDIKQIAATINYLKNK